MIQVVKGKNDEKGNYEKHHVWYLKVSMYYHSENN